MQLYGAFVDAEVGGDLLVHPAAHHVVQDFELALGEFCKPLAHLALPAVGFERSMDGGDELFLRGMLLEEIDGAVLHGAHRAGNIGIAGEKDHRQCDLTLRKLALQFQSAQAGHLQVDDHAAARLAGYLREELRTRGTGTHGEAMCAEQARHRARERSVVVDDVNDGLVPHAAATTNSALSITACPSPNRGYTETETGGYQVLRKREVRRAHSV